MLSKILILARCFFLRHSLPHCSAIMILITICSCSSGKTSTEQTDGIEKINGFNLVAPRQVFSIDSLRKVKETGADWVAVVPYAFCNATTGEIVFDHERQWWGEKQEGIIETVKMAQSLGLKVMLKPHLWVGGQGWAGELEYENDSLWTVFEKNYQTYVTSYAKIADSLNVEMYCIGTEIRKSTAQRPSYWLNLIDTVREEYEGLLTYAANWDEYDKVSFWNNLDFIGIDAYFPLSTERNPGKADLLKAWEKPIEEMKKVSLEFQKPVLFTEYGYESIDYNTIGHWNISKDSLSVNFDAQKIAFESIYEALENSRWWKGGFIWKWHLTQGGTQNRTIKAYTPQNKPVMKIIKKQFSHQFPSAN